MNRIYRSFERVPNASCAGEDSVKGIAEGYLAVLDVLVVVKPLLIFRVEFVVPIKIVELGLIDIYWRVCSARGGILLPCLHFTYREIGVADLLGDKRKTGSGGTSEYPVIGGLILAFFFRIEAYIVHSLI